MIREIDRRIRKALGRIRQPFRAVIQAVNTLNAISMAQMQGLEAEQLQDSELFQHFGFTSNPPPGTMAIVAPIGGKTSHGIVIATEHGSYRLAGLVSGDAALYDAHGHTLILSAGGIAIVGDLTVNGKITASGDIKAGNISVESHTHGGVQAGSASTGAPQ